MANGEKPPKSQILEDDPNLKDKDLDNLKKYEDDVDASTKKKMEDDADSDVKKGKDSPKDLPTFNRNMIEELREGAHDR
ncbi:hypothetical protein [Fluviicola taffensis]|uniref:hypothetical protein n=1 Tax=Fluviicola taffensis TaxID=191579 RepID=UPI003137777D